jgi:hypothetical protein
MEISILALLILVMINLILCDFNRVSIVTAGSGLLAAVAAAVIFTNLMVSQRTMNLRLTCMVVSGALIHAVFMWFVINTTPVQMSQARSTAQAQTVKTAKRGPASVARHGIRKYKRN